MKKTFLTITLISLNIVTCFGAESFEERSIPKQRVIIVTDVNSHELERFEVSISDIDMPRYNRLSSVPLQEDSLFTLSLVQEKDYLTLPLEGLCIKPLAIISSLLALKNKFHCLNLGGNKLTEIAPRTFEKLTHLKRLNLFHNGLTQLPHEAFTGLNSLEELVLTHNDIQSIGTALHGLNKLEKLYIATNFLRHITRNDFSELTNLRHLCLNYNPIKEIEEGAFSELTHLELLDFEYTGITKEEFESNREFYGLRPECVVTFE